MRAGLGAGAAATLAAALFLAPGLAQRDAIMVTLDSPDPFVPAYGEVEIHAVVGADEGIERVVFYVDGVVVGEMREPPFKIEVNVGDANVEHSFQVVAYGVSGSTGTVSIATPSFRVDEEVSIELQQLYVTVSRDGERVGGLRERDFEAFDEGRSQRLVTFARGDIPFTGVVLVDSSVSMQGPKLRSALEGARRFFESMKALDEGKLLVFSDRILHSTPFTSFPRVLTAGLGRVRASGGTALNDHLYLGLKELEERQGRRVVVLLSDGVDSHSVLSINDVLAKAGRSQALIYWLRLPYSGNFKDSGVELPGIGSAWRSPAEHQNEFALLRQTVEDSGGRIQDLGSLAEIESAFQGITEELRDQYVLGYYPHDPRRDGSWRKVEVRVRDSSFEVRSRGGYIDF